MNAKNNVRVCFTGPFTVDVASEVLRQPVEPQQLLIRSIFTLISPGTELALYTQTHVGFKDPHNRWAKYPFYPGYAAVGQVENVGSELQGFAPGDIVFFWGQHQQYTLLSPQEAPVLPVPDGVPWECVPFARMAQIAYTAVLLATSLSLSPGAQVAVLGLGLVGNLAAQLFQIHEANVTAFDLIEQRCELAQQCGIAHTSNAAQQDPQAVIKEITGGQGAHIVVEATGSPALVSSALAMACTRGEVILLGSPRGSAEIDVYSLVHRSGVCLKGAHEALFPMLPQKSGQPNRASISEQMLQHLQKDQLSVKPLISQIVFPHRIQAAYEALLHQKEEVMGILVDWSKL